MIHPLLAQNDWLLDQLSQRDPATGRSCPGVLFSDTIIYKYLARAHSLRYSQPFYWYYTSNEGELYRKEKERISNAAIYEDFRESQQASGAVASFLAFPSFFPKDSDTSPVVTVEHLSHESFRTVLYRYLGKIEHFMLEREKPANAILIKFVEPKNHRNCIP